MPNLLLPDGWIQQHDTNYDRPFWVDTRAHPPRATWVHPYEGEQFLVDHPEVNARGDSSAESDDAPPTYDVATGGRASDIKEIYDFKAPQEPDAEPGPSKPVQHKRGVFGKLKDKTIGTKEEREEQKRIRAEQAARVEEQAHRRRMWELEEREERKRIRAEQVARTEEQARQRRMRELEEREAYMRAHGGYAPYHPSQGGPVYANAPYAPYGSAPARGPGIDNTAALLLGGLAGGLLLGDIFGGGF